MPKQVEMALGPWCWVSYGPGGFHLLGLSFWAEV